MAPVPAPVGYQPVPTATMELTASTLHPPSLPVPRGSCTNSETSGSDHHPSDRSRHDRRRARLNTELLNAVLEGDLGEVTKKLESGASVNATCRRSRTTVLQLAVACGYPEIVQLLLCRGAAVVLRDKEGRQAVHFAAATGSLLLLQLILDSDPSVLDSRVCVTTKSGKEEDHNLDSWSHNHDSVTDKLLEIPKSVTPLHLAVQRLHLDCVSELLQRGARVDLADDRGLTPLDVVGEESTPPNMADLADAFPSTQETFNRIRSLRQRLSGNSLTKSMVKRFAASSEKKQTSKSPIRIAQPSVDKISSPNGLSSPAFNSSNSTTVVSTLKPDAPSLALRVVNELIKRGAKMPTSKVIVKQGGGVHNQISIPMTCLHTAVEREDTQLVEYLLENEACQLTWNKDGLTALHLAVSKHLLGSLRILLEKNKSSQVVDARDIQGRTPLHLAVEEEQFTGVSLLLEAGADVKVTSNDYQTVLHIAAKKTDPCLLEELLTIPESVKIIDSRNNRHETPLFCAVSTSQLSCVTLLLSHGADVTACLPGDITLLHVAAERGNKAILEALLLDHRIQNQTGFKDIRSKEGKGGTTALHLAAMGGFVDCVKSLLSSGCNVYAVTTDRPYYGSTALHLAAIRGHSKVIECIINHDRNTMCMKNSDGWYPLHVAARFGKRECVQYMLLNGANLAASVFDSGGFKKTALDIIVNSINQPLNFLEKMFDRCLEKNEFPLHNPNCVIRVRYDILQPLGPHRKQMKVLDSLLNCGKMIVREKLLLHPLVETFLYLKWKKLRLFFFLIMLLYMVFTISLTTMAMLFYVIKIDSVAVTSCIAICRLLLCSSLTLMTLQELLQASRMQKYYLRDMESWVKWSTFSLATVVVVGGHPSPWLVHVSSVAVLLSWLELLFLLSRWPSSLGFYILMFFTVAKNVLRVFATFTFVILGFMFAFMIHFQASGPFENWWEALVKVLVMTLEFEYESLYEGTTGISASSVVGRLIFLSFMILVAIVLMNLLVGLAVSDITTLEKQGRAQRLAKQIEFLSLLELLVYNSKLFCCCPSSAVETVKRFRAAEPNLVIEPGKPLRNTQLFIPKQLMDDVIDNLISGPSRSYSMGSCDDCEENKLNTSPEPPSDKDNEKGENANQEQLNEKTKEMLDFIVSELVLIKQELENLRLNR